MDTSQLLYNMFLFFSLIKSLILQSARPQKHTQVELRTKAVQNEHQ